MKYIIDEIFIEKLSEFYCPNNKWHKKELKAIFQYQDKYFKIYETVKYALNKIDPYFLCEIAGENEMRHEFIDLTVRLINIKLDKDTIKKEVCNVLSDWFSESDEDDCEKISGIIIKELINKELL
jgi:hypothetical protein